MTETIHLGDTLHNTLLPCLKGLEFTLYNVEYHAVKYLAVEFVGMVVSRRVLLGSQRLEFLQILVEGRAFQVPFTDNGGLEKLNRLRDDGMDLQLDLDD